MRSSQTRAANAYQSIANSYTPKQKIKETSPGEADLSYYEELTRSLAQAVSSSGKEDKEEFKATLPKVPQKPIKQTPKMIAIIEERGERIRPLAKKYISSLDLDPDSEEGKLRLESTIQFYSRNDAIALRFEKLVANLST